MHGEVKWLAAAWFLSLSCCVHAQTMPVDTHASGVFINARGDVLTAHHAVTRCQTVYVIKDGRVVVAQVAAASEELDLAVLNTTLKPYLFATFVQTDKTATGSFAVFSEAYSVLQRLPDRASLLSNAVTVPGTALQLVSAVKPGASGSAVVDHAGLILGVVTERIGLNPVSITSGSASKMSSRTTLSTTSSATLVHAVDVSHIKQFLQQHAITYTESDAAQLGVGQSPAARAATLAVGVVCG